jgi:acetyl esterase/lipase
VFRPPGDSKDAPGVLLVHGGGWRTGDPTQLRGYGVLLGREGYVCVAPEYRLLGEAQWPAQIHDVKAALRWMRANADGLGLDPARIAVEGNSAGGHLALVAAGTPGLEAFEGDGGHAGVAADVVAVIAVYPPTQFSWPAWDPGTIPLAALIESKSASPSAVSASAPASVSASAEAAAAASPITYAGPGFPPTMLIHGTADQTVPVAGTVRMYEALAAAGVPVDLHLYAEQPHAFDALPRFGRQCAAEMLLFLERYAGKPVG